ncbi:MAG TPA: ABC transporter permease [Thermoanaerobaculia bacterium]|nr:ABC transporter permease [Thermoanaerobaculia bacterium]
MFELVANSIPLAIVASIPLLLAVEGELLVQRGGIINLGIEGMMLTAAMTAALAAALTNNVLLGFAGGAAGALLIAALFGLFAIVLRADQIVTGTAINLLALGGTSFVYREVAALKRSMPAFHTDPLLPLAWLVAPLVLGVVLWNSSFGLRLRACGENPAALLATGRSVRGHRWIALTIEALLVGIGGAYLALALSSGFAENMTAGRGFIALSIVIFGRWKIKGALVGTAIFGIAAAMQYALQAANRGIPYHLLLAVPYVVTLLILCGVAGRVRAPESLGRP